jgi:riboflavin transporter FmnP
MVSPLKTEQITGTTVLGALVVVLDYMLKFSGVKIPFPFLPTLRFDLDGIPIVLALFLYGPYSASMTCLVAFAAILFRSGIVLSASMKGLAEFATILGMLPFYRNSLNQLRDFAIISGVSTRVLVMAIATLAAWPLLFKSTEIALAFIPFSALFNAIAGVISISGGWLLYKAIFKRVRHLLPPKNHDGGPGT